MKPYLDLCNVKLRKKFRKYFDTEYERNKFADRLKFSKKLVVLDRGEEYVYNKK
jgi:hypothetical protein